MNNDKWWETLEVSSEGFVRFPKWEKYIWLNIQDATGLKLILSTVYMEGFDEGLRLGREEPKQ